jgi:predicted PurR-regulated permease PerM
MFHRAKGNVMSDEPTPEEGARDEQSWPSSTIGVARLALTAGAIILSLYLAAPFLSSLTWALVLAVVFVRPHSAIERALKRPSLAATFSVLVVALIVVAPLLLVSDRLIREAVAGVNFVQEQLASGQWRSFVDAHPWLQRLYTWIEEQVDLSATLRNVASWLTNTSATVIRQSTGQILTLLLSFYLLFFFLRDRRAALETVKRLSPFSDRESMKLLVRVRDTIHATIYGTLVVAALQGALGGVMFWWLNFPSPALWGLIMGLLSIVPVLGSFIVWVPATVFLAIEGRWGDAITLAAWGALVIGTADNLVRPLLMGESLRLHTVPTFIAMIGGLQLFGASGIVLGPIAFTTTMLLLEFWRRRENR